MSQSQFKHPLNFYPSVYGVSYRTILRYAEKGYPLDNEEQTRLLIAGQKTGSPGTQETPTAKEAQGSPARLNPPLPPSTGDLGLPASIQRLEEAEATAHAKYEEAKQEGNQLLEAQSLKSWVILSEQLRKTSATSPDVAEANKTSVQLSELQTTLGELFQRLRQDLESLPLRIALELEGKDLIGIREVLTRETDGIIDSLFACRYFNE